MLLLIVVMVVACVWVELKMMDSVPWLFDFISRYRLLSLGFSLGLSVFLGGLFGASGLIVFAAGVLSTVVVQPFYAAKKSGQWDVAVGKYHQLRLQLIENKALIARRTRQTVQMMKVVGWVLYQPVRAIFFVWDVVEYVATRHTRSS